MNKLLDKVFDINVAEEISTLNHEALFFLFSAVVTFVDLLKKNPLQSSANYVTSFHRRMDRSFSSVALLEALLATQVAKEGVSTKTPTPVLLTLTPSVGIAIVFHSFFFLFSYSLLLVCRVEENLIH